ncbi:GNAT family N-acetyltransferase [Candidatus Uabimicrobium sp. HlEnr_7]|uniref:GNAT family N-acetyltransferase n=1 Tax=Candidatus Uabimicrobium helgolandensis TaxID=3095367 RepID=UPI0035589842
MLPRPFPFEKLPTLQTKKLVLQQLTNNHLKSYHELCSEEKTMKSYGLHPHTDLQQTQKTLNILASWFQANTAIRWGVFVKSENQKIVGDIGFWQFDVLRGRAEIAAKMSVNFQGQGFAYEALCSVIDFGFSHLNLNGIDANIALTNKAPIYLVKKLGFREIGIRPELSYSSIQECWQDMAFFSLNRKDWNLADE